MKSRELFVHVDKETKSKFIFFHKQEGHDVFSSKEEADRILALENREHDCESIELSEYIINYGRLNYNQGMEAMGSGGLI